MINNDNKDVIDILLRSILPVLMYSSKYDFQVYLITFNGIHLASLLTIYSS